MCVYMYIYIYIHQTPSNDTVYASYSSRTRRWPEPPSQNSATWKREGSVGLGFGLRL